MTSTTSIRTPSRKRLWWLLLALPATALAGLGIARAQGFGDGPGFGPMAFHGGGSPEEAQAFMKRRLEKMLDLVKATDAQRAAIKPMLEDLHAKVGPIHQQQAAIHESMVAAFSAPTIDAGAVENLRQQGMKLHDQGSRIFLQSLVQVGNVLTVEQRQTLIAQMKDHHGHHPGR